MHALSEREVRAIGGLRPRGHDIWHHDDRVPLDKADIGGLEH